MTKPVRIPPDRLDLENLEAMLTLPGYHLVASRIRDWIEAQEKRLRTCTPEELRAVQVEISVLEKVLKLPETLSQEIRKRCP